MNNHFVFFYGDECEHCKIMEPIVEKIEKDLGVSFDKKEIDHDDANYEYMKTLDKESCGGVPFFVDTKTGKTVCGEVSYEELKGWAEDK
ncbi:MAG: thioredoxin domain-containing protein [Candidatus Paceibacterota bacterium]